MKITFKVSSPKENSIVSLIKEVNKISCRIFLDLENGYVTVEDVNDTMLDGVIELVDNYYTILGVDIDNIFEETTEKQVAPVIEVYTSNTTDNTVDEIVVEEVAEESGEVGVKKEPKVLEPQAEDDLIIKKVEFENELVQNRINHFLKTAYWVMYNGKATEKDISEHILTCMSEISMRFSPKPIIEFSIGDIVDVNYGFHLPGEIIGAHVHGIVCHVLNKDMAYVVPITKARTDIYSSSYLFIDAPHDATYVKEYYKGGTALLDKGKYVRVERFNEVIGKTTPEFFEKLLKQLVSTFDFTKCLTETVKDDSDDLPIIMGETTEKADETITSTEETVDEVVENSNATEKTTDEVIKTKTTSKRVGGEESALLEVIGFAFDKLDSSKKVEEQIETFLNDIGMATTESMVTESFVIACDIKKINYENILLRLHEQFPSVKEENIKKILKESFKIWLDKYPTLAEKYPKISFMSILRVFAKRFI